MKTKFKKLFIISITLFSFLLIGCQDEVNEIIDGNDQEELLVAQSEVAILLKSTATKDGSEDNIIDNASCISIQLPVHVIVNDLEIIVDTEEDFDTIEDIFDEYFDDDDFLEYVYPIVIILSDYTEVTIENSDQLEEYTNQCEEDDDDIECIDFKYPISYSIFNTSDNRFDTVVINSDREMFQFIEELDSNDVVSLDFPITLLYSDGSEIEINSMIALEDALFAGAQFCDEDDDNDYGDDDFDIERLNELLVKCPWVVHDVLRNSHNLTINYKEYLVSFKEGGVIKVLTTEGEFLSGTWVTEMTDHGPVIVISIGALQDFTLTWKVEDISNDRIKLHNENGNRIILQKNCDIEFDFSIERIKNILSECLWRITRIHVEGVDHDQQYIGTPFKFLENGVVHIRVNGEPLVGQWIVENPVGTDRFFIKIVIDGRPELNLEWNLQLLGNSIVKFENANSILILNRLCDSDEDVTFVYQVLNEGEWFVALYEAENTNETVLFENFAIDFLENGAVFIEGNNQIIDGSWLPYRKEGLLFLGLNFGLEPPFDLLNFRWKILEINETRIKLVDFASDGSIERILVLERT
jgi:hypothetical protein